ncbi:MazG nucleotide pyrophosphohydrolase domain-containing protein [Corynebacterium uberis]|uniref:MazG nucleotide pyrophosphohydrolase domain-containing protein n=1 Tax=Corynebacterium uberis TaxID=2883169 RepID=UPI001D0B39F2|nr:MazG nucleotide pyrophosphohydrolase domain-containing protein [Corynebacterium uberis]UDL78714.1 nucleoside triphosphate hydrolase [Corynebacterium uberis]
MTVVLLDARWPDLVPLAALQARLPAPVTATAEVPERVVSFLAARADRHGEHGEQGGVGTLVTCDATHPRCAQETVMAAASVADPVAQACTVMAAARRRGQWEARQTHASLLPYLAEEAGEFAQAVRAGESEERLRSELADVLLQVLFHACLAQERGAFGFAEVAQAFVDKMRSRAPYLFDGSSGVVDEEEQQRAWQAGKDREAREV